MRKGPLLAALLCVAGAFLVLVAAGREWVLVSIDQSALLPAVQLGVPGSDLRPGLAALGLVGLAGVPAMAASRGRGRVVVGLLLALTGLGVVALVAQLWLGDPGLVTTALQTEAVRQAGGADGGSGTGTAWPVVTASGGLLLAAAGLLMVLRGRQWAGLGRSYEAPAAHAVELPASPQDGPVAERELWEALDRGDDPTGPADPPARTPGARD